MNFKKELTKGQNVSVAYVLHVLRSKIKMVYKIIIKK